MANLTGLEWLDLTDNNFEGVPEDVFLGELPKSSNIFWRDKRNQKSPNRPNRYTKRNSSACHFSRQHKRCLINWTPEVTEQALDLGVVIVNDTRLDKASWQGALV